MTKPWQTKQKYPSKTPRQADIYSVSLIVKSTINDPTQRAETFSSPLISRFCLRYLRCRSELQLTMPLRKCTKNRKLNGSASSPSRTKGVYQIVNALLRCLGATQPITRKFLKLSKVQYRSRTDFVEKWKAEKKD